MTENRIWYVNTNRKTYGPYTKDEIVQMLKSGNVKFNDYLFKEGYSDWDYIYNVSEFDRRLIMPDGGQPLVEAPKAEVPVEESAATPEGQDLWFVHDGEHQMGPYASSYIKESLNNKTIFWTYYVWRDGFENWVQIKECKEFDRRRTPRGQSPVNVDITTNLDEIKKQAVPSIEQNRDMYGNAEQPASSQYGITEAEQEELKGKYPVKAVVWLVVIAIVLFAVVRLYPKMVQGTRDRMRENRATSSYNQAQNLIQENKLEDAYNVLFDLEDMYPDTKAARKSQNDIRAKEPTIKGQIADETRRIKSLMDSYTKKYGIMPSNAVDISYVPPFYIKYFADTYYKRDANGKVAVMTKGIKMPVQQYAFLIDGPGKDNEREDMKPEEFALDVQDYIKLSYVGKMSVVKPIDIPQIVKKNLQTEEKKATPPVTPPAKDKETTKKAASKVITPKVSDEVQQEQTEQDTDYYDNGETIKKPTKKIKAPKVPNPDEEVTDETAIDETDEGQYVEDIKPTKADK